MKLLDLTLDSAAENLALDEALLEAAEASDEPAEVLRLWESPQVAAVAGRSSRVRDEIDVDECRRHGISVLRRCSGGASVLIGPGCFMYSLVLSYVARPQLRAVEESHRLVLGRLVEVLDPFFPGELRRRGISDLARGDRKCSGNSLRCRKTHCLYHGTLLYDFPLEWIASCLREPPREPDYRAGRSHVEFVGNLPVRASDLHRCITDAWSPRTRLEDWPREAVHRLARERYESEEWNFRR
jgi:lipoate-protein ligase A